MTRWAKKYKKLLSCIILSLFMLMGVLLPSSARALDTAPINLTTNTAKSQLVLNDDFVVNYAIQPQNIPYSSVNVDYAKDREIVLVLDTSGSMNDQIKASSTGTATRKKIDIMKDAVTNFVTKFNNDSRINISIVKFSSYAKVLDLNNGNGNYVSDNNISTRSFVNMSNPSSLSNITSNMNKLSPDGGTNTGDGLRRAYWILKNSPRTTARKYIILLTDGLPTGFTATSIKYSSSWSTSGQILNENGAITDYYSSINRYTFKTDDGSTNVSYAVDYSTYDDISVAYAKNNASTIKNDGLKMNSSIISLSNTSTGDSILSQLTNSIGGDYKVATNQDDMNSVYNNIAGQVQSDIPISAVNFNATFPSGIQIKPIEQQTGLPKGFVVNGQTLSGSLNSINYRKDDSQRVYVADPIYLSVKLNAAVKGAYILGQNNSIYLTYRDISGNMMSKYFPTLNINVYSTAPPNINATLTDKPGSPDVYILTINSGTNQQNDAVKMEVNNTGFSQQGQVAKWVNDGRPTNTTQFTFEINKSEIIENNLYIRATDKSSPANIVYETVPFIELSELTLRDQEHTNNQRLANFNIQTENNSIITNININGTELVDANMPLSTNAGIYEYQNANFNDGSNTISVQVKNQYNNTANITFSRIVDAISPTITGSFDDDGLRLNVLFSEPVNLAWIEFDLNGDGTISNDEKATLTETTVSSITSFLIPSQFYNKQITIKARDLSGNIGQQTLAPILKSLLLSHGVFVEKSSANNNSSVLGQGYIVNNGDGTVSNTNLALTRLGALIKLRRANSTITININKNDATLHGSIDNVEVKIYKVKDDNTLEIINSRPSIESTNKVQKRINVTIPSNQFEAGRNYIITYTLKPNIDTASDSFNIINSVTVDGTTSDLKLIGMPLPDVI